MYCIVFVKTKYLLIHVNEGLSLLFHFSILLFNIKGLFWSWSIFFFYLSFSKCDTLLGNILCVYKYVENDVERMSVWGCTAAAE